MTKRSELVDNARAEALFVSRIPTGTTPSRAEATEAIRLAVRGCHGTRGCAAAMATAYGDSPETASVRMRWARDVVLTVYAR
ncbi:hypothetical protein GCM10022226_74250 [Sphaerisporangium flaviroseum]|uniref:Uncharacterized protein n=1 Tax=Sphaerisporangium flaviroseum TaxID=509199 RepID=A0ABP7JE92_9ACTN